MANTIIGRILSVSQAVNVSKTATPLMKRELVLDASRYDEFTGEKRENYPSITFVSKNCSKLDGLRTGELVEVSFVLQGRSYTKDGQTKYFTDIIGYKVEPKENVMQAITPKAPSALTPTPAEDNGPLPF